MAFFEIKGELKPKKRRLTLFIGTAIVFLIWWLIAEHAGYAKAAIPNPVNMIKAYPKLLAENNLMYHAGYSILLNVLGYVQAILVSFSLGFLIGLSPTLHTILAPYLAAMRYWPIVVLTESMIAMFGIALMMKVQFLSLGITVYLLPMVVDRVMSVKDEYLDTAKTFGASKWQQVKTVIFPAVVSEMSIDTLLLVAISWTYISYIEMLNQNDGGLGALLFIASKSSDWDMFWALVFLIGVFGLTNDRGLKMADRTVFPFKYN